MLILQRSPNRGLSNCDWRKSIQLVRLEECRDEVVITLTLVVDTATLMEVGHTLPLRHRCQRPLSQLFPSPARLSISPI